MSKYYKAEDVERLIENIINVMIGKEEPIETALCELPIIYIVRCEDCKYWADTICERFEEERIMFAHDFCSYGYGERKDDE